MGVFPVADVVDNYLLGGVIDAIDHPVVAYTNPVEGLCGGKLDRMPWRWVVSQGTYLGPHSLDDGLGKGAEVLLDRRLD